TATAASPRARSSTVWVAVGPASRSHVVSSLAYLPGLRPALWRGVGVSLGDEAGASQVPQSLVERLGQNVVVEGRPGCGLVEVVGECVECAVTAESEVAPPQFRWSQTCQSPGHEGEPAGGCG